MPFVQYVQSPMAFLSSVCSLDAPPSNQQSGEQEHGNVVTMLGRAERSWVMKFVGWVAGGDVGEAVVCITDIKGDAHGQHQ